MIKTKSFDLGAANDAYQFMKTGTDAATANHNIVPKGTTIWVS